MQERSRAVEPQNWRELEDWAELERVDAVVTLADAVALSLNRDPFNDCLATACTDSPFLDRLTHAEANAGRAFPIISRTLEDGPADFIMVKMTAFVGWALSVWSDVPSQFVSIGESTEMGPVLPEPVLLPADCRDYGSLAAMVPDAGVTRVLRGLSGYVIEYTASAVELLASIQTISYRQQGGDFTIAEAAQILADTRRLNGEQMLRDMLTSRSPIEVRRPGSHAPLGPAEAVLPLRHTVTAASVNAMLRQWGAPYEFPAPPVLVADFEWAEDSATPPPGYVALFDLAQEFAAGSIHGDSAGSDVRRQLEAALAVHGIGHDGRQVPSVVKMTRRLFERGEIAPIHAASRLPATSADEINDRGWWLTSGDAAALRASLQPVTLIGEFEGSQYPQNSRSGQETKLPDGVAQDVIAESFGSQYRGLAQFAETLADKRAEWLRAGNARMADGKRGNKGNKALWNPLQVARNLLAHKRWEIKAQSGGHAYSAKLRAIDAAFERIADPEWSALWAAEREGLTEYLDE